MVSAGRQYLAAKTKLPYTAVQTIIPYHNLHNNGTCKLRRQEFIQSCGKNALPCLEETWGCHRPPQVQRYCSEIASLYSLFLHLETHGASAQVPSRENCSWSCRASHEQLRAIKFGCARCSMIPSSPVYASLCTFSWKGSQLNTLKPVLRPQ